MKGRGKIGKIERRGETRGEERKDEERRDERGGEERRDKKGGEETRRGETRGRGLEKGFLTLLTPTYTLFC